MAEPVTKEACCADGVGKLHKVAGILIRDKKVLAVRREGKKEFITPGGGHEVGETYYQTVRREFMEEVQLPAVTGELLGVFTHKAIWSDEPLMAHVYFVEATGEPKPDNEIVEYKWLGRDFKELGLTLGSILEEEVIPELIRRNLI